MRERGEKGRPAEEQRPKRNESFSSVYFLSLPDHYLRVVLVRFSTSKVVEFLNNYHSLMGCCQTCLSLEGP